MSALITARHELMMMFRSFYGWVAVALLLAISSYFFFSRANHFLDAATHYPNYQLGVMSFIGQGVFGLLTNILLFVTPLFTAAAISSEYRNQTIVLLKSSPISSWEILLGKYLAYFAYYLIILFSVAAIFICLSFFSGIDWRHFASLIFGSILIISFFVSVGIYSSSLSKNFFVSAIVCLVLLIVFSFVLGTLAQEYPALEWLVFNTHIAGFLNGEVDTRHIGYFLLMTGLFLFLTHQRLEGERKY